MESFEQILKKQCAKKTSSIYQTNNVNQTKHKPQDVIETVYSQIKAIQSADIVKKCKLNVRQRSVFLEVNKGPVYKEVQKQSNFDTQCVSDTQLMNIIDNVEAIDAHKGMTQEFDNTFIQTDIEKDDTLIKTDKGNSKNINDEEKHISEPFTPVKKERDKDNPKIDEEDDFTDNNNRKSISVNTGLNICQSLEILPEYKAINTFTPDTESSDSIKENNNQIDDIKEEFDNVKVNTKLDLDISMELFPDNSTQIIEALGIETERSPSPVLNTKAGRKRKRSDTPPSFSVPLDQFENFENAIMPLIDIKQDSKIVINSQIKDSELYISMNENRNTSISPIFNISDEKLHINKEDLNQHLQLFKNGPQKKNVATQSPTEDKFKINDYTDTNSNDVAHNLNTYTIFNQQDNVNIEEFKTLLKSDSLKDEILFSSDEEEHVHKELEDLPLTCALETSFYDEPGVLEKTMYVGFQTASNKSIQIHTDSFEKAQSILNNDTELSLTELVKIYDKNLNLSKKTNEECTINIASENTEDKYNINNNETKSNIKDELQVCEKKKEYQGFKTANNMKINISEKAMAKIKDVFKDIDLNDQFNDSITNDDVKTSFKSDDYINRGNLTPTKDDNKDEDLDDDLLIQEFENIEMSLEEKEANTNQINFEGFKTASDKKIEISDAALLKIKNVFQDIDLTEINHYEPVDKNDTAHNNDTHAMKLTVKTNTIETNIPSTSKGFKGFKTASNKEINISEGNILKTKNVLKDIDKYEFDIHIKDEVLPTTTVDNKGQNINNPIQFEGFMTASHKPVKVTKKALENSKILFQDIDIPQLINNKSVDDFQNKTSYRKLREQLKKISGDDIDSYDKENNDINPMFEGFRTASNKAVKISKESLARSSSIFKDIDVDTGNCSSYLTNIKDHNTVFEGFQTAGKKPVTISEESLAKSGNIFSDLEETGSNKIDSYINVHKDDTTVFKGFQTAGKKPVTISEDSLAKTKRIFEDLGAEASSDNSPYSNIAKHPNRTFKGFQTASKKPVIISEESLAKTKRIFGDIDAEASNDNRTYSNIANHPNPTFKGFQTASNKAVDISEKALFESKKMLQEFDTKIVAEDIKAGFSGFKTASNKGVGISEKALEASKKLLEDLGETTSMDDKMSKYKVETFVGFKTASKKSVSISNEALEKTKTIFKDIDTFKTNLDKNITEIPVKKYAEIEHSFKNKNETKLNILPTSNKAVDPEVAIKQTAKNDSPINICSLINTQISKNFEDSLCTEDFKCSPKKRCTSPILSCPRAKKRKFEVPHKSNIEKVHITKHVVQIKNLTLFEKDYKKNKIYKLKDLKVIANKTLDPYLTNFNINNILEFQFFGERNDLNNGKLTIDGLKNIFKEGVYEKIIPENWLDIHIKLIIWKLISYEKKYDFTCTAKGVMNQLKYRYDKELYRVERSALRKIMEKDDVPSKTMVLCVADIFVNGQSVTSVTTTENIELLLTDGWYFIKGSIDKMLAQLVFENKIVIGCKLATNGAELLYCEQGVSPWEDTSSIKLKLHYNSTRLARWDARLGYFQSAILSQLSAVKVNGGKICKIRVFVTRVYPLLYVEKFEDGSTVTRSERLEHLHQIKYETDREAMLEKLYEEVAKELSDQESQDSESYPDIGIKGKAYDTGSQIAKMMKKSKDPMEFRAQLSSSQVQLLQDHTSKYRDRMLSIIQDRMREKLVDRNVVPLARARIADVKEKDGKVLVTAGMLSIWKPNDSILELLKENSWIEVMNVTPTAIRYSEIQISAGRQSVFRPSKRKESCLMPHLEHLQRKIYKIEDLSKNTVNDNEIDTVGIIFLIDPSNREFDSAKQFQNVYLADENKNMICINFWGGIKKFGFLNIIDTGQIISCANLQRRAGNTRKNIPQYRVTEFTSMTKTPKNLRCREMIEELDRKLGKNREKFCEDCVAIQSNYAVIQSFDENSPYRFNKSEYNISRNKQFIDTPLRQANKDEFNLTGLDFESSFKQKNTQLSPNTLLRKKKVNERIARLKTYGEPPPLSPINIVNKSKNATSSYKSPLLLQTSDTSLRNSVTRGRKIVQMCNNLRESSTSPILNKTSTRRNVNPIKLDFSKNSSLNKDMDQFAEDFDGSPPLSLD